MDNATDLALVLTEFVAQSEAPCLLLMIADQDTLFPAQMLSTMDRGDLDTIYLVFTQPCTDAATYMDAIVDYVRTQVEALKVTLVEEDRDTFEAIPTEVLDSREPPAERLAQLVEHIRTQVGEEVTIVWALLPETLGDADGFRELTRPLVPTEGVPDWHDGHRFILREQLDGSVWAQRLHADKVEDALVYRFDMSPERAADDLARMAADPAKSDDERMGALLMLAGLDMGHQRYPEALEKYDALQKYFGATNNPNLRALALGGSGDTLRLVERPDDALARYRQGLAIGVAGKAWPVTLTLLIQAGETCLHLEVWDEADGYFGLATTVAAKLMNATALCNSHEQQGVARAAGGNPAGAAKSWIAAKDLAVRYGYSKRFHSVIDRLIVLYETANLPDKVDDLKREKACGVGFPTGDSEPASPEEDTVP